MRDDVVKHINRMRYGAVSSPPKARKEARKGKTKEAKTKDATAASRNQVHSNTDHEYYEEGQPCAESTRVDGKSTKPRPKSDNTAEQLDQLIQPSPPGHDRNEQAWPKPAEVDEEGGRIAEDRAQLKSACHDAHQETDFTWAKNDEIQRKDAEGDEEWIQVAEDRDRLRIELQATSQHIVEMRREHNRIKARNGDLLEDVDEIQRKKAEVCEKLAQTAQERDVLQSSLQSKSQDFEERRTECNILTARNAKLSESIDEIQRNNVAWSQKCVQIAEERDQFKHALQAKSQDYEELQTIWVKMKATNAELSAEKDLIFKECQQANVRFQGERRAKDIIQEECDRFKAAAAIRILHAPYVENTQALYLNKQEMNSEISHTLTNIVSDWNEVMGDKLGPHAFVLPLLLAQVFLKSQALVETRRLKVYSFFLCGSDVSTTDINMDQETAYFMLKHMRLHFKTIFPLTGQFLESACDEIIGSLAQWMSATIESCALEEADKLLRNSRLRESIIKKYLYVLACSTLHNPRSEFEDDAGEEQSFDPQTHAASIDDDVLAFGAKCVVVFPALKAEPGDKAYILPCTSPPLP